MYTMRNLPSQKAAHKERANDYACPCHYKEDEWLGNGHMIIFAECSHAILLGVTLYIYLDNK